MNNNLSLRFIAGLALVFLIGNAMAEDKPYFNSMQECLNEAEFEIDCYISEYEKSDKQLNISYKKAKKSSYVDSRVLLKKQRLWIKYRDNNCPEIEGNTSAVVEYERLECLSELTLTRANELDALARGEVVNHDYLNSKKPTKEVEVDLDKEQQPKSFKDHIKLHQAESGQTLPQQPKITPDNKIYFLVGKIENGDSEGFIAKQNYGKGAELYKLLGVREVNSLPPLSYFKVIIPDDLRQNYLDNAKINAGFNFIGRYVGNIQYEMTSGQEKTMPVLQAVYWKNW